MKHLKINTLVAMLCIATNIFAQEADSIDFAPYQNLQHHVNDFANLLPDKDAENIETLLSSYADTAEIKIMVVTMSSIGNMSAAMAADRLLQSNVDNGVLMLVVPANEYDGYFYAAIATTYDINGVLPQSRCNAVTESALYPSFEMGDYSTGILAGVKSLTSIASGYVPDSVKHTEDSELFSSLVVYLLILIIAYIYVKRKGNSEGEMTTWWIIKRTFITFLKILFFYIYLPIKFVKYLIKGSSNKNKPAQEESKREFKSQKDTDDPQS